MKHKSKTRCRAASQRPTPPRQAAGRQEEGAADVACVLREHDQAERGEVINDGSVAVWVTRALLRLEKGACIHRGGGGTSLNLQGGPSVYSGTACIRSSLVDGGRNQND